MAPNRSVSPVDIAHGHATTSPPPLSKRDKRRTVLLDKLNSMIKSFNQNLRPHYEAQLNAIQVDINLIMRADPYQNKPLPDSAAEIEKTIDELYGPQIQQMRAAGDSVAEQDFLNQAGKLYADFAVQVNNLMEEKDVALTNLANKHTTTLRELDQKHRFHVQLAHEEHRLLAESVRSRLFATLEKRKRMLLQEKENLDIGDSNASLLRPDQYHHMNPASPGGTQHARKTRNARHRVNDPDELPNAAVAQENRRKRKAVFEEGDAGGSPGPGPSRYHEYGANSPYRDAKQKSVYAQYEAPAYSIERLFTEKELAMNMNLAATAASNFMVKLKANGNAPQPSTSTEANGMNGHNASIDADEPVFTLPTTSIMNETDVEDDNASTPLPLAAPEMDRGANNSQYAHATRGATRNALTDPFNPLSASATAAPGLPVFVPAVMGAKANGAAPAPREISTAEFDQDIAIMARQGVPYDDATNQRLLEITVGDGKKSSGQGWVEYRYQPPAPVVASDKDGMEALSSSAHLLAGLGGGGIGMSRQTSHAGSEAGGVPMSRTGSAMRGGVGLRRTASYRGRGGGL